jgi:hypothetical protein
LKETDFTNNKAFVGGVALTGATAGNNEPRNTTLKDVALAGRSREEEAEAGTDEVRTGRSKRRTSSVSSLSTPDNPNELAREISREQEFEKARDHFDEELASLPTFTVTKSSSPARDSRFHEVI